MMYIAPTTTVRNIAVEIPATIRIFEKLGIDYCCGGQRSLESACSAIRVPVEEVIFKLKDAQAQAADHDLAKWQTAPLAELTRYIVEKHHGFVREELPRLGALAKKVRERHGDNHPELLEIEDLFEAVSAELRPHMFKEEQILFPYIGMMEVDVLSGQSAPPAGFGNIANPVSVMMDEHDRAGEAMRRIAELSSHYTPPEGACPSYRGLFLGLFEFEQDLHRHVHLENNILFPRAIKMQEESPSLTER